MVALRNPFLPSRRQLVIPTARSALLKRRAGRQMTLTVRFLIAAHEPDRCPLTRVQSADTRFSMLRRVRDGLAFDADQNVARLDAGLVGRCATDDFRDQRRRASSGSWNDSDSSLVMSCTPTPIQPRVTDPSS